MPNKRQGKWQPFDALAGHKEALRRVEKEFDKCPRPILSEDELEQLNYKIRNINCKDVIIKHYHQGFFKEVEGEIKKIDEIKRELIINNERIKLCNIVEISEKA
ncbi:MAG TPA: YolD-like family protein [Bacilli bacterium]